MTYTSWYWSVSIVVKRGIERGEIPEEYGNVPESGDSSTKARHYLLHSLRASAVELVCERKDRTNQVADRMDATDATRVLLILQWGCCCVRPHWITALTEVNFGSNGCLSAH